MYAYLGYLLKVLANDGTIDVGVAITHDKTHGMAWVNYNEKCQRSVSMIVGLSYKYSTMHAHKAIFSP